ncbi:MAG: hypothetical protein PHF86_10360 [Candidatus Nanoarchaeia archaeon]|nr:hypothetical protein [Candidatus Nanoarchaeia archaeon]
MEIQKEENLRKNIEDAINKVSEENESNTPDFILAEYLINCLKAFDLATKQRDKWYNVNLEPCNSYFLKTDNLESKVYR